MANITYYVSRWVTFVISPFLLIAAVFVAAKAKVWFGVELDTGEIVALILGLVAPVVTWLVGRVRWEIAQHFGTRTADDVEEIAERVIAKLPPAPVPNDAEPGAGSPESPRAPSI